MTENLEHLSSAEDDSDEDDDDYKPDGEMDDLPSECESDGDVEDTNDNDDTNEIITTGGRHRGKKKTKKSSEKCKDNDNDLVDKNNSTNEEDEKQKTDSLWADFLKDTKSSTSTTTNVCNKKSVQQEIPNDKAQIPATKFVKKIFDFAGDKVEIECPAVDDEKPKSKSIINDKGVTSGLLTNRLKRSSTGASGGGGLGAVLGQIGKKTKISTLEKSKLDWNSFKQREGIDEQLQTYNKGKDGYLERQDFLQRTDVRQFQQEKQLRLSKR